MGVPSFFVWLMKKYSKVVSQCLEKNPASWYGHGEKPNLVDPNPNGFEVDNFYLDMNSIIHPCCRPEHGKRPETDSERMQAIFVFVDRLVAAIRPRKLLYLAIDGVAPRAKMNQQRSRRFRSARDALDNEILEMNRKEECFRTGVPYEEKPKSSFDSNVITPGTEFLLLVSESLKFYVKMRQAESEYWNKIKIIVSDGGVAGEGEHKIMDYIRRQRIQPDYDPNTSHVIYGADADLLMLALACHEPNFRILRELPDQKVLQQQPSGPIDAEEEEEAPQIALVSLHFAGISILREYLMEDLRVPNLPFPEEPERVLDDFVFMCFLVGNDFLPHLPSLEIREGSLDLLMELYRRNLPRLGGYLTHDGELNLERVEVILRDVGVLEDALLKARLEKERHFARQQRNRGGADPNPQPEEEDPVKLGEPGWKDRYYACKFDVKPTDHDFFHSIRNEYTRGLCWVLKYYFQGCASWDWYYPFHYAPFASDLVRLNEVDKTFAPSVPRKPFEQLLGVLPAASGHALPEPYRKLMTDPNSILIQYYPENFKLDMNGKKKSWLAVVILPFISQEELLTATQGLEELLGERDLKRNKLNWDILYVHKTHPMFAPMCKAYKTKELPDLKDSDIAWQPIDAQFGFGIHGFMSGYKGGMMCDKMASSPILGLPDTLDETISVLYKVPDLAEGYVFKSELLPGVVLPPPQIDPSDVGRIRAGTRNTSTARQIINHFLSPRGQAHSSQHAPAINPDSMHYIDSQNRRIVSSGYATHQPRDRYSGPGGYPHHPSSGNQGYSTRGLGNGPSFQGPYNSAPPRQNYPPYQSQGRGYQQQQSYGPPSGGYHGQGYSQGQFPPQGGHGPAPHSWQSAPRDQPYARDGPRPWQQQGPSGPYQQRPYSGPSAPGPYRGGHAGSKRPLENPDETSHPR